MNELTDGIMKYDVNMDHASGIVLKASGWLAVLVSV